MTGAPIAKRLLEATAGEHPVISVVFDLNSAEFATAPARATQATSLLDAAHNLETADQTLNHDARQAVRSDLERLKTYLGSDDLPVSGAEALAIFVSQGSGLFETVGLSRSSTSSIYLDREPHIEPVVIEPAAKRWCAVLVSSRDVTVDIGAGATVATRSTGSDYVRGHSQSDGNDERGREQDIEGHLIAVSQRLAADHRAGRFDVLAIGGPVDALTGLEGRLPDELRSALAGRLEIDLSAATEADVAAAVARLLAHSYAEAQEQKLAAFKDQLAAARGQDGPAHAVAGIPAVLEALTEQRVETLLLADDFHAAGARCSKCRMLLPSDVSECPIDGTATAPVADLREPMIAAAVRQDATVLVFPEPDETLLARPDHRTGALLRF
jgi:peptide chain release factor subunit 1